MGLRFMQIGDLEQVVELENKLQLHPWPREAFLQALAYGHTCCVFEDDGKITGYGVANGGHGRVIGALTLPAANALYARWLDDAAKADPPIARAEIEADNAAARARLVRFGFTMVGVRDHFYGLEKHAQVWEKNLGKQGELETLDKSLS